MADIINAFFEVLSGFMVLLHCRRVWIDKGTKGVSIPATFFFALWGFWNLYYYPSLGQWWSLWGGVSIVSANCLWIYLMMKYRYRSRPVSCSTPTVDDVSDVCIDIPGARAIVEHYEETQDQRAAEAVSLANQKRATPEGQKFPAGSRVRIVDTLPSLMDYYDGAGCLATVRRSAAQAYSGGDPTDYALYVDGIGEVPQYYPEYVLTLIEDESSSLANQRRSTPEGQKFPRGSQVRISEDPEELFGRRRCKGLSATVVHSHAQAYSGTQAGSYALYIDGIGEVNWYPEGMLTLVGGEEPAPVKPLRVQKFPKGTRVRIADAPAGLNKYQAKRYVGAGCLATVLHTYAQLHGGTEVGSYVLDVDELGTVSWIPESRLTRYPLGEDERTKHECE